MESREREKQEQRELERQSLKRCLHCLEIKSNDDYYPQFHGRMGTKAYCKLCYCKRMRERYRESEEYREKVKANYKRWYIENPERAKQSAHERYLGHKERHKGWAKNHYEANKETILERKKQYYQENKERIREQQREYYQRKKRENGS